MAKPGTVDGRLAVELTQVLKQDDQPAEEGA